MAHISVHDTEEEGERDDGVDGRINLLVRGNSIVVNHHLEVLCELVCLEMRRWAQLGRIDLFNLQV